MRIETRARGFGPRAVNRYIISPAAAAAETPPRSCHAPTLLSARSLLRKSHIEPHLHAGSVLKQPGASSKSLPCFQSLMVGFQLRLVRGSWQPLLVLGLAQERVDLGAREASLLLQT